MYFPDTSPWWPLRGPVIHCFKGDRVNPLVITASVLQCLIIIRPGAQHSLGFPDRHFVPTASSMMTRKRWGYAKPLASRYTNSADLGKLLNADRTFGGIHHGLPVSYASHTKYRATLRTQLVQFTTHHKWNSRSRQWYIRNMRIPVAA